MTFPKHRSFVRIVSLAALCCATSLSARAEDATFVQGENPYYKSNKAQLDKVLALAPNVKQAKNVILFVGDGYGVATMTAARIFEGQSRGVDGPSNKLAHESFPYSAISRTYSHDSLVTDSAPSAVAMTTGVKSNNNMLGLSGEAVWKDCEKSKGKDVTTIGEIAKSIGMSVGAVSTARITDATPAAVYAHSAHRSWENDAVLGDQAKAGCQVVPHSNGGQRFALLGDDLNLLSLQHQVADGQNQAVVANYHARPGTVQPQRAS